MRVRMLDTIAGAGYVWRIGEEHDVENSTAKAWVKNGSAEPVAVKPSERSEKRTGRPVTTPK